jgi:modulator of FtsH protease
LARAAFWALLALLAFGIVALFVAIPGAHVIYSVAGLVIFGAFTVIDFNRLRNAEDDSPVLIAASIFLDVFFVDLFGGSRD